MDNKCPMTATFCAAMIAVAMSGWLCGEKIFQDTFDGTAFGWSYNAWDGPNVGCGGKTGKEAASSPNGIAVCAVSRGFAGWFPTALTAIPPKGNDLLLSLKIKTAPDYIGNKPYVWISWYSKGKFLSGKDFQIPGDLLDKTRRVWTELRMTMVSKSIPENADSFRINLTSMFVAGSEKTSGALYFDDVALEARPPGAPEQALKPQGDPSTVWQIGDPNAAENEYGFQIKNRQWEYARFPELKNNPGFDPQSGVFTYEIKSPGVAKAQIPQYLGSTHYRTWMPPDECVTGLKLAWQELSDGFRRVEFSLIESNDKNGLPDDLRLALPDGQVVFFQLSSTAHRASETPIIWSAEFSVKKGANHLELNNVMNSRNNFARLSSARLSVIDKVKTNAPVLEARTAKLANVFYPGENAEAEISTFNTLPPDTKLKWEILDWNEKIIASKEMSAANGISRLALPTDVKGWFRMKLRLAAADGKTLSLGNTGNGVDMDYAVVEKPYSQPQPNSFFGWVPEFPVKYTGIAWFDDIENKARLAKLAGYGWVRIHSFDYGVIQPERDRQPDFRLYDRVVDIQKKNNLCVMASICYSPKWATDSTDENFNISGYRNWACTPPKISLWRDWCGKIAERYKDSIQYWEIWNEAAYVSCYWLSGSALSYAELLASSYEAVKKANPNALTLTSFAGIQDRFLAEVLKNLNGKRAFDLLGFHYVAPEKAGQYTSILGQTFESPLIDTEEALSSGGAAPDDKRQVECVLKLAAYPAHGVTKNMQFSSLDPPLDNKNGILRTSGVPRPAFAATRTLTHRLEGTQFVGILPLGSEVKSYLFAKGSTPVLIAWCERKDGEERSAEKQLHVGNEKIVRIDPMDNESSVSISDGVLKLSLGSMPAIFEGGDLAALKELCALSVSIDPKEPTILTGTTEKMTLTLVNKTDRVIKPELEFSTPSALKIDSPSTSLTLKAGEARSIPFEIQAGKELGRMASPVNILFKYRSADDKAISFAMPLNVNTTLVEPGENLLGQFNSQNWSLGKGSAWLPQGGVKCLNPDGKNAASFMKSGKLPVLAGDRYALVGKAKRGELDTWSTVQYSLFNEKNQMVFPTKPGGNLLSITPDTRWKSYGDTFKIERTDVKSLELFFLASYGKAGEIYWDDIRLIQLAGKVNLYKAMWQGDVFQAGSPPKIDADLSDWEDVKPMIIPGEDPSKPFAFGYARWDNDNIYLAFRVRDEKFFQTNAGFATYNGDCIEFAVDPTMDGKDYNEYSFALTPVGVQLFNRHSFTTPELLQTMYYGVVKEAQAEVKYDGGFINYELRLPLTSVHPLSPKVGGRIGFSWVVDDNNGDGRKFQEWSEGIARSKDPSKYGMLRFR